MRYINELREGDNVSEVYLCKVKNIAKTKAGKTYYSMILQDKTGVIDTKIWDLNNGIENFEQMDYIRVEGNVTRFQGSLLEDEYVSFRIFSQGKCDIKL